MKASNSSSPGEITKRYLAKYPKMASRSLARKMREECCDVFTSIEQARTRIRYYRGQKGEVDKKKLVDHSFVAENGDTRRSNRGHVIPSKCDILIIDIETVPHLALPWGCYKQYIGPEQILSPGQVLCWAAKWLGEKKVMFDCIAVPGDGMPEDPVNAMKAICAFYSYSDMLVCESLWALFDRADIIIAHNGKAFDTAYMNTRWLDHGMPPPAPYKIIDTLWTARRQFRFPSNKLDAIARYRQIGKKIEHEGLELWKKCMCGDAKALDKMKRYNIQDVNLLEEIYLDMRPWILNHPNVQLDYDDGAARCLACGSSALKLLPKTAKTPASQFDAFRCQNCGKIVRSRQRQQPAGELKDRMANV